MSEFRIHPYCQWRCQPMQQCDLYLRYNCRQVYQWKHHNLINQKTCRFCALHLRPVHDINLEITCCCHVAHHLHSAYANVKPTNEHCASSCRIVTKAARSLPRLAASTSPEVFHKTCDELIAVSSRISVALAIRVAIIPPHLLGSWVGPLHLLDHLNGLR